MIIECLGYPASGKTHLIKCIKKKYKNITFPDIEYDDSSILKKMLFLLSFLLKKMFNKNLRKKYKVGKHLINESIKNDNRKLKKYFLKRFIQEYALLDKYSHLTKSIIFSESIYNYAKTIFLMRKREDLYFDFLKILPNTFKERYCFVVIKTNVDSNQKQYEQRTNKEYEDSQYKEDYFLNVKAIDFILESSNIPYYYFENLYNEESDKLFLDLFSKLISI